MPQVAFHELDSVFEAVKGPAFDERENNCTIQVRFLLEVIEGGIRAVVDYFANGIAVDPVECFEAVQDGVVLLVWFKRITRLIDVDRHYLDAVVLHVANCLRNFAIVSSRVFLNPRINAQAGTVPIDGRKIGGKIYCLQTDVRIGKRMN